MGWFKRLCLFVYGLAGLLALFALALPWVGPYTEEATSLLYVPDYFRALEVVVGITGVGCLICLLRALFTPRNYKNIIITSDAGDQITVTRSAIASQAQHIVERDGSCTAGTVRVRAKKRGSIRVFVRVTPKHPLDVVEKGRQLQAELDDGLARIAADKIKSVNLEFTDPEEMDDGDGVTVPATVDDVSAYTPTYDASDPVETEVAPVASQDLATGGVSNGITVSMSSFHRDEEGTAAKAVESSPVEDDGATTRLGAPDQVSESHEAHPVEEGTSVAADETAEAVSAEATDETTDSPEGDE